MKVFLPEPELHLVLTDPDPRGPKTSGSGSPTLVGIRVFLLSFSQNSYFGFLKLFSDKNSQNCENIDQPMSLQEKARMLQKYNFCEN